MRTLLILSSLLFISFSGMTQASAQWKLYINKVTVLSSSVDSVASIRLPEKEKGVITFDFANRDTRFKRSLLIMNEKRNTLAQKQLKPICDKVSFSIADLVSKTGAQPFTVYIIDVPSDPAKAAIVRMAPVAICKVVWKK